MRTAGKPSPRALERAGARRRAAATERARPRVRALLAECAALAPRDARRALAMAVEAERLARLSGVDDQLAEVWYWQGRCGLACRRLDEGMQFLQRALREAQRRNDRPLALRALQLIAREHLADGRFTLARTAMRRAAIWARTSADPLARAQWRELSGLAFLQTGRIAAAERAFRLALELTRRAGVPDFELQIQNDLGMTADRKGRHAEALAHYREAQAICAAGGFRRYEELLMLNAADSLMLLGRLDEAYDELRRALAAARKSGNRRSESQAHTQAAELLPRMHQARVGLRHARRAILLCKAGREARMEAAARLAAIRIHLELGDRPRAAAECAAAHQLIVRERIAEFRPELETLEARLGA